MAAMLTRSVTKSLRLSRPSAMDMAVTIGLAFCLHPTYVAIATAVSNEYKLGEQTTAMLNIIAEDAVLLIIAMMVFSVDDCWRGWMLMMLPIKTTATYNDFK